MFLTDEKITEILGRRPLFFREDDYLHGKRELDTVGSILSLVVYDYEMGDSYARIGEVRNGIRHALKDVLYGGKEPTFDNCHNWGYPTLAQVFALIKNKPELWNLFNEDGKSRINCLMKMFVLAWNFGCNRYNHFSTGIGLHGNYSKGRNPNYPLSNDALILYCIPFFGLEEVNRIVSETPYSEVIADLEKYGFANALRVWTTPGFKLPDGKMAPGAKELYGTLDPKRLRRDFTMKAYIKDEDGNIYYAGNGKGVTFPFYYDERDYWANDFESYPSLIYKKILTQTFSGGLCQDSFVVENEEGFSTFIVDRTHSPYNGMDGMILEFNGSDSGGLRSSLFHSEIDFYLVAMMVKSLELLGIDVLADVPELLEKIKVGMLDCAYKKEHGYIGYSMGEIEDRYRGFNLDEWIEYWKINYPLDK